MKPHVPRRRWPKLFAEASVVVLPYESGVSQSGPLHKALASGRAILATDIPTFNTVIDSGVNGLLVSPGNEEALAGGLRMLLSDPSLWDSLGKFARSTAVSRLDWSLVVGQTLAVYESLLTA